MKTRLIVLIVVICSACSTPSVLVKKNISLERLGICFEVSDKSIPLISKEFEKDLDQFIKIYNAKPGHKFELYHSTPFDSASLKIKLIATQLVTPVQQTTGVLVSIAGLSLPFIMISAGAPIYLGFYYFPQVKSLTELSLSPDIANSQKSQKEFILTSPGFLKSPEKQIAKHVVYFNHLLSKLIAQIEKQTSRKKVNAYTTH